VFERTTALQLRYKDAPQIFRTGDILVEAFFVPHAGWPVEYVRPKHSTGIHVPSAYADPAKIPDDLQGYDLFRTQGESRPFKASGE